MDDKTNMANFGKCIAYLRENLPKLHGRKLCIGFGEADYRHPWMRDEFQDREMSVQLNVPYDGVNIKIETYGGTYMQSYGYEQEAIDKWREGYRGTGMACPDYKHTWDELDVVPFLLDWKHIKGVFDAEVAKYESLDEFEV